MKKLLFLLVALVVVSTGVFGACAESTTEPTQTTAPPPSPVEPIVVKLGYDIPPMLPPALGLNWFAEEVTKATEGRVTVEVYPAASLASQASGLESVLSGVADMYMLSIASHRKVFPVSAIVGLPGIGFPDDTLEANNTHMETFMSLLKKYPVIEAEYDDYGEMFYYMIYSESYLFSKGKEIRVPADCNGLKLGSNGIRLELAEQLGAAPVTDIPPLAYEKLQTGVTDATFTAVSAAHDFSLYEVTDYCLDFAFGGGGHPIVINKDTWNKISPQDQQIMKDLAPQGSNVSHKALADLTHLSWQEIEDLGMKVTPTAAEAALWEDEMAVLWDKWIEENEAAGVSNARDIFNDWKAASDKAWGK